MAVRIPDSHVPYTHAHRRQSPSHYPQRRSHPQLSALTITPLTSHPLPPTSALDSDSETDAHGPRRHRSYIAPASLPQTPRLLSRSSSRGPGGGRRKAKSHHALASLIGGGDDSAALGARPSAKSTTALPSDAPGAVSPSGTRRPPPRTGGGAHRADSSAWLLHTAASLAAQTAEAKGQAWLATRSSSTSLVDAPALAMSAPASKRTSAYRADDEASVSPVSARRGTGHRTAGSRGGAATPWTGAGSRVGSRVGSRAGSTVGFWTPAGRRTPGIAEREDEQGDYFGGVGVDFVNEEDREAVAAELGGEEDAEDEEFEEGELKKLVWGRVGGWVDWAVGWVDRRAGEWEEDSEKEEEPKTRKRREEMRHEEIVELGSEGLAEPAPADAQGMLGDAKWLWGVARNVMV